MGGASTDVAEVDGSCGKLDEGHESFEAREPSSECDERPKRHPTRLVHRCSGLTGEQQRDGIPHVKKGVTRKRGTAKSRKN